MLCYFLIIQKGITKMGNQTTKDNKEGQQQYQRLGPVTIKQISDHESGETISTMHFTRLIQNEKILKTWNEQTTRIYDSESKDILLLPQKHIFQKAGLCGSGGHVHLTYENFPYVLDSEIKNRKKLNKYFIETQMWYLLYNIIRAGNKFQKIGKKVGDINPHNVVINDDGQIKVICTCSIPNQLDNFQKLIQDKNARVYLAPEQLNEQYILKCQYPPNVDPCKAQVFSIGLTILSSGILQDCQQVYTSGKAINEGLINQFLERFKSQYSPYLFAIVVSMLNFDPKLRKKASQIYNELFPYENFILDLEQFSPPYAQSQGSRYIQQNQHQQVVRQSLNQQDGPYPYFNNVYPSTISTTGTNGGYSGSLRSTYQNQGAAYVQRR